MTAGGGAERENFFLIRAGGAEEAVVTSRLKRRRSSESQLKNANDLEVQLRGEIRELKTRVTWLERVQGQKEQTNKELESELEA